MGLTALGLPIDSIGVTYTPSLLLLTPLVSLIPLKCPLSTELTPESPLTILFSFGLDGESVPGIRTGEMPGLLGEEEWETWDTVLVWLVTEGEEVRP